jgi:ureidoacrylate peracid hydrolase
VTKMPELPLAIGTKLTPESCAVIVIDVQNDFCSPGGYMDKEGQDLSAVRSMLPRLRDFIVSARAARVLVIWVQSAYGAEGKWYLSPVWLDRAARSMRGGHIAYRVCEPGTWGAALATEVGGPEPGVDATVTKHRYSAFFQTELELILRAKGIATVVLAGVSTNTCVETSARDAFMRDFYVILADDLCATYSQAEHDATLWNIRKYFGQVLSSEEVLKVWSALSGGRAESSRGKGASDLSWQGVMPVDPEGGDEP